jgi:tetratricopeptide (TPR) repeat protein
MEPQPVNSADLLRTASIQQPAGSTDAPATGSECEVDSNPSLSADAEYLRGLKCREENRLADAMEHYALAIALQPDHARAHNNMGVIQQERGELDAAASAYQQAIEAEPRFGVAWFNLGNCFREANCLEEAVACYRQALTLMPADGETRINLAIALRALCLFDASLAVLDEVPSTSPDQPKARFNRSLVHLLRGELGPGWDEYEGRLQIEADARRIPAQRWDGTPLGGRSVLILAEQGIGDQVMFASCLPDLLRGAGNSFVECDNRLVPLFARSFPQVTAIAKTIGADTLPSVGPCDVIEYAGSLPRFLRRRVEDFPAVNYCLRPDPFLVAKWRAVFARSGSALRIGISWQGGRDTETRRRRSIPLDRWGPIFQIPGVRFVNIQYGPAAEEASQARAQLGIPLDDGDDCDPLVDLDDFAAKIAALDLVLSVDNSTAHLAAAIGQRVWTLLPFAADWRWMVEGETTPWYSTMRLLRCRVVDDWHELLHRVARQLTSAALTRGFPHRAA